MRFGPVALSEAEGAFLGHSLRAGDRVFRKGTRLGAAEIAAIAAAGLTSVVVARLDPGDITEDEAAATIAESVAGEGSRAGAPFTGRANIVAEMAGVVVVDRAAVDALNGVDPAITLATVAPYARVAEGAMIATVKIIPFAVPGAALARLSRQPAIRVAPFRARPVGLVATELPSLKPSVMDKTRRLFEARLQPTGSHLLREDRVAHDAGAVAAAIKQQVATGAGLVVVFGASAVVDADDVIPAAIRAAGGEVIRLGMPVDPGNLLVLGSVGTVPVIGAPGCARSPKENGFDWVLWRLLADVPVTSGDIAAMGVGGLLMEIPTRPQPREPKLPRIAAVLLAAGSSRRMGSANKLVATIAGRPLVRIAAEAALASRAVSLTVVTGHDAPDVEAALDGLDVAFVHNFDHAAGLSTSLRTGLASLPADIDGALILLADMPDIGPDDIDALIGAFGAGHIVVPVSAGQRGNPVVWPRRLFPDLMAVTGDTGGRGILAANAAIVREVELGPAVTVDVDTPEALAEAGGSAAP